MFLLRNILTYYNSSFEDPGEIEPVELIHFILEQIHIENNKTHSVDSIAE